MACPSPTRELQFNALLPGWAKGAGRGKCRRSPRLRLLLPLSLLMPAPPSLVAVVRLGGQSRSRPVDLDRVFSYDVPPVVQHLIEIRSLRRRSSLLSAHLSILASFLSYKYKAIAFRRRVVCLLSYSDLDTESTPPHPSSPPSQLPPCPP